MSTPRLASEVLALRGHSRAVAAAVYTLLGSDDRVRVDGDGIWSLAVSEPEQGRIKPLDRQEWAVVDVETTGGSSAWGHRVIEIGVAHVARGRVVGTWESLIDPQRPVPRVITSLTGISQPMLAGAPTFRELAPRISEELCGRVFVGHNAGFDWRFVSAELERCAGRTLSGPRLCTLRLARRTLPHLRSRSLGALADFFGIPMERHHRALDDALATAHLLVRLLDLVAERDVRDWHELQRFLRNRRPRRRRRRTGAPRIADVA